MAQVSVIIPAYNQAAYLAEAITSVYRQTFTDWELIIVDDGSTDDTPQVLARFQDVRVRVVRQANRGVSAARNAGIRASTAPFITFLDADDLCLPDHLVVLHRYLCDHPAVGLVVGEMQRIDAAGNAIGETHSTLTRLDFPDLLFQNDVPLDCVMMRREWLECVGGFDETMHTCEDWDVWLRLLLCGCKLARVEKVLVGYRIHTTQVTRNADKMRAGTLRLLEKFFSLPNVPAELLAYKNPAMASALIRTAARAFRAGSYEQGKNDLHQAVDLDASLTSGNYKKLLALFVGWANNPQTDDPEAYLLAVARNLPPHMSGLARQLRKAIAGVILGSLFGKSRQVWQARRQALLKAIMYDPAWLANRGVWRMLVDAWLMPPVKHAT